MLATRVLVVQTILVLCLSSAATAKSVLDFEGLANGQSILGFYNGGAGGDYGISFSPNALALIDADAGGSGNFANEPSPDTIAYFRTGPAATMNVPAGFIEGFSFYYTAKGNPGYVRVYDGLGGVGAILATLDLPLTPGGSGDPTGSYASFVPVGVLFDGIARSVDFGGTVDRFGFDNITLGSAIPGESSAKLVFRDLGQKGIPGIDHSALYITDSDLVYESHPYYVPESVGVADYWDPLEKQYVTVVYDDGVQAQHTYGSFMWDSTDDSPSWFDVQGAKLRMSQVSIDSDLGFAMATYIDNHDAAKFLRIDTSDLDTLLAAKQKGADNTYTCVGLLEAAAESVLGFHGGQGFVPNRFEDVTASGDEYPFLTPSLLKFCAENELLVWASDAILGWFDPVDFILTDPLGRRLGHVAGMGEYAEIPDAFYSGDGDWETLVVFNRIPGNYLLTLYGTGEDYRVAFATGSADTMGWRWSSEGYLGMGETRSFIPSPEGRTSVLMLLGLLIAACIEFHARSRKAAGR
jgi:hypothetical protein